MYTSRLLILPFGSVYFCCFPVGVSLVKVEAQSVLGHSPLLGPERAAENGESAINIPT